MDQWPVIGRDQRPNSWCVRGCSSHPASSIWSDRFHDRCRDHDDDGRRDRFSANDAPNCVPVSVAADCVVSAVNGPANAAVDCAASAKRYGHHHDCAIWIGRSDALAVGSCGLGCG